LQRNAFDGADSESSNKDFMSYFITYQIWIGVSDNDLFPPILSRMWLESENLRIFTLHVFRWSTIWSSFHQK